MEKEFKYNPKLVGSGIIECIPQEGVCPNNCPDCFFQSGRSYLHPLEENLPHIPTPEMVEGRVVRMNDGNDSNVQRDLVEKTAKQYKDYFFNTSIPKDLGSFSGPVVLTVNPGKMTDVDFHRLDSIPTNLMFVRVRVNMWNLDSVVKPVVNFYTGEGVPVILTLMNYYKESLPPNFEHYYEKKKHIINTYWCLTTKAIDRLMKMDMFRRNPLVYLCGYKGTHSCKFCGNCLREYFATKERLLSWGGVEHV